jgi:hypothetical protein
MSVEVEGLSGLPMAVSPGTLAALKAYSAEG